MSLNKSVSLMGLALSLVLSTGCANLHYTWEKLDPPNPIFQEMNNDTFECQRDVALMGISEAFTYRAFMTECMNGKGWKRLDQETTYGDADYNRRKNER